MAEHVRGAGPHFTRVHRVLLRPETGLPHAQSDHESRVNRRSFCSRIDQCRPGTLTSEM
jgi:hypothetical protein